MRLSNAVIVPLFLLSLIRSAPPAGAETRAEAKASFVVRCVLFNGLDAVPKAKRSALPEVRLGADPRFSIAGQIERALNGKSPWRVGSFVHFVIHSPSLMLGGYDFNGKRFDMTFSVARLPDGSTRYDLEEIEEVEDEATGDGPRGTGEIKGR